MATVNLFHVCNASLTILASWGYIGLAKASAKTRAYEKRGTVYHVCDVNGAILYTYVA